MTRRREKKTRSFIKLKAYRMMSINWWIYDDRNSDVYKTHQRKNKKK